jgi:uncharacterized protein
MNKNILLFSLMILLSLGSVQGQKLYKVYLERDFEKFQKLVQRKPELINEKDKDGYAVIANITASTFDDSSDYLREMLRLVPTIPVNDPTFYERPLLCYAIYSGITEKVKLLINYGANVNLAGPSKWTPLMAAVSTAANEEIVDLLIQNGARVNISAENGRTPIMFGVVHGEKYITDKLLSAGADVTKMDLDGNSVLHFACGCPMNSGKADDNVLAKPNTDIVISLIRAGADVNLKNVLGAAPMVYACKQGHIELVRVLIANGAKVNQKDNRGSTPLMYASYNGNLNIVKVLVRNSAELKIIDDDNYSAIDYAKKNNHQDIVSYLEDALQKNQGPEFK